MGKFARKGKVLHLDLFIPRDSVTLLRVVLIGLLILVYIRFFEICLYHNNFGIGTLD